VGEHRFSAAAERNLRWVLSHRDPSTGWIDACGFSEADHKARQSVTHTIAYTLAGVLAMGERLQIEEAVETVRVAAEALMHRLERSRTLAGVLDDQWKPRASFVCLTGNVQLASIWLRLAETTGDLRFVNAAFKAIDEVKRAQSLASRCGRHPRRHRRDRTRSGGDYIRFGFPNWAAKFFLDALLAKGVVSHVGPQHRRLKPARSTVAPKRGFGVCLAGYDAGHRGRLHLARLADVRAPGRRLESSRIRCPRSW
jgi:hypothetical protein